MGGGGGEGEGGEGGGGRGERGEGEKVMLGMYVMKGMETKLLTTQNNLLVVVFLALVNQLSITSLPRGG